MPLGYHLKKGSIGPGETFASAIIKAYDQIQDLHMAPCVQIFVLGPSNSRTILSDDEKRALAAWPRRGDVVVHGAYINIPWSLKPGGIEVLKTELAIASDIGANGVVVHLHPKAHSRDTMARVLNAVMQLPANILAGPRIWLENKPVREGPRHCTPNEVKELFEMIQTIEPRPKIGFCIDTQHAFASGVDITTYEAAYSWLDSLRAALPGEFPMMIHLNDSAVKLGSGLDRHADLCEGEIWNKFGFNPSREDPSRSGITACVLWAEEHNAYLVLETPNARSDLEFLQYIGFK